MNSIAILIIFYFGWFVCVHTHNIFGALIGILLTFLNIYIIKMTFRKIAVMFFLAMFGYLTDALAFYLNIYEFNNHSNFFSIHNLWIFSIWLLFVSTFESSLKYLNNINLFVVSILGMFGGLGSYIIIAKMHVITFSFPILSYVFICSIWAILLPALFKIYQKTSK